MKLRAYAYTNRGGRDTQRGQPPLFSAEDGVFVPGGRPGRPPLRRGGLRPGGGCPLRGPGGAEAPDEEGLLALFRSANEEILRRQTQPGQEEMRTTAVALKIAGEMAVWAHIGDSRLYRFRGGELAEVTKDHSVTYRKYLGGEISYMDVYHDDDRGRLLRVLGKEALQAEAGRAAVEPGDAFLLCSDGFWSSSTARRCRRPVQGRRTGGLGGVHAPAAHPADASGERQLLSHHGICEEEP